MDKKYVCALSFVVILAAINLPMIPGTIRIVSYSLLSVPSLGTSGMLFHYYDSVPYTQSSLMTTAAKSIIAWHMLHTASTYSYVAVSHVLADEMTTFWEMDSQLMCTLTPWLNGPYLYTAIFEFQLMRALFEMYPYRFLTLDHLTYPLVVTIPVLTAVGQIIIWNYFGTLCEQQIANLYLFKADLDVELSSETESLPIQLKMMALLFMLGLEVFMRIRKAKRNIFRNEVAPLNMPNTPAPQVVQIIKSNNIKVLAAFFLIIHSSYLLFGSTLVLVYFQSILTDFLLLEFPFYWVLSSEDIKTFIKLRFNQLKLRLGHF